MGGTPGVHCRRQGQCDIHSDGTGSLLYCLCRHGKHFIAEFYEFCSYEDIDISSILRSCLWNELQSRVSVLPSCGCVTQRGISDTVTGNREEKFCNTVIANMWHQEIGKEMDLGP